MKEQVKKEGTEPQVKNIKKLPDFFGLTQSGTHRTLEKVFENDGWYIYRSYETNCYEVFRKKLVQRVEVKDGKWIKLEGEFKEAYPKDNDFGKWAWCCTKLENAKKRIIPDRKIVELTDEDV